MMYVIPIAIYALALSTIGILGNNTTTVADDGWKQEADDAIIETLYENSTCIQVVIDTSSGAAGAAVDITSHSHNFAHRLITFHRHSHVVRTLADILVQNFRQHHDIRRSYAFSVCDLVFVHTTDWRPLFQTVRTLVVRFLPHTKLAIYAAGTDAAVPEWTHQMRTFMIQNAVHVVWMTGDRIYRIGSDATQEAERNADNLSRFLHINPLKEVSVMRPKPAFNVALYHCEPYVMMSNETLPDGRQRTHFDGIEYRLIMAMGAYYNLVFKESPFRRDYYTPYAFDMLRSHHADIALCCPWQDLDNHRHYAMTTFVDYQCGTFLVPKEEQINAAANVYMPLSANVWTCTVLSMLLVAWLMPIFARQEGSIYANDGIRCVLDLVCISTNHGLSSLDTGRRRASTTIRIVLMAWLFGSWLLGVGYSTGYTALMSHPVYTASVDTVAEYVERDFVWSYVGNVSYFAELADSLPVYQRVYERIRSEESVEKQTDRILAGDRRITIYSEVLFDRYVTYARDLLEQKVRKMRPMKTCWYSHYTALALRRFSPYKRMLDDIVTRCHITYIIL